MPGVLLTDDAEQMYADRLRQHAQSVWDTIANAPQTIASVAQPAFQAASSAAQNIQPIVPSTPAIDPSAVADAQQSLLQHAQGVWDSVQNAAPSPQEAPQPTQASPQAVDPSAVNDASQRLLQHANDTWQSVGQGLTSAAAPVQQAATAVANQVTSPATTPQVTPSGPTPDVNAPPPDRSMSYQDYARAAARRAGIDPDIFVAQIQQESGFNPTAKSGAGALGIAQFMPATAAGMNVDPTDPYAALDAAAKMDAQNLAKYNGDYSKTLAAYNAGGGAVDQYGGVPPYKETQTYVSTILDNAKSAVGGAVQAVRTAVAPPHAPSPPEQTDGTQIANQPNDSGQIFPLAVKPDNAPTATYHSQGGSDLMAPRGTPVLNMQSGKVEEVFTDNGSHTVGGNAVLIHGDDGLDYYYAHFDQPTALKIGQRVGVGEQIGAVGNSGNAYKDGQGPTHLHIGIGYGISNGVGSEGGLGENYNAQALLTKLEPGVGQASGGTASTAAVNPDVTAKPSGAPSGPIDSTVQAAQQGWQAITGGLQAADQALQDLNRLTPGTAAVQAVQGAVQNAQAQATQAVNAAGQTVTDLGAGARTALQQAADTAGQGLPDVTGTLKPENSPLGGEQSPLGKIAQGQKVTPTEQLEAAPQIALGYEQSRGQAAAGIDPLRQLPGGNVIGPTVEQLTDPASWVGVGSVKSAIGVAASVAASVGAQQVAENLIPDSDPNKGVKVALVSLLGAFTGGPVGERTIAPLVDRADALVSGLGADGASALVRRAADAAGERVAPAVRQFATEELGAAGRPADVAAARAGQAFTAPTTAEEDTTRMYHGTGADFPRVDPTAVSGEGNLYGPGYYLTSKPEVAGGIVSNGEQVPASVVGGLVHTNPESLQGTIDARIGLLKRLQAANPTDPKIGPLNDSISRMRTDLQRMQDAQSGSVLSTGYAQSTAGIPTQTKLLADLNDAQTFLDSMQSGPLSRPGALTDLSGSIASVKQEITALTDRLSQFPRPNVRAVDVPQNLKLLDVEAPAPDALLRAFDEASPMGTQDISTGDDLYRALVEEFGSKGEANDWLAANGYDGITYEGGKRIPMTDVNGMPVEHQATVVFPDSLDKVRNAISGTQGGVAATQFAARLGGAAAGGVAGYQTTPEDASPQERALRTAGGAVAGYAGVAAGSKVVSALSDILKPDLAGPQLEQAIKTVNESDATAPQITAALDQVRQMPGTAELAPVRAQVPQSSTDLLQAMLDAARAKGADPEKLNALEQQIAAMDPNAATRRGLGDLLTGEGGGVPLTPGALRATTTLGGAAAGGLVGNATTPDDASTPERALRILAGAGIGAGVGSAAAGFRGTLPQDVLANLRNEGVLRDPGVPIPPPSSSERLDWLTQQGRFAPPEPPTPRGPIARGVDWTKQALLSNPATHTAYVIGNVLELLRSPAALAMGGRGDDAIAGLTSVARGIPAAADAARAAFQGQSLPTLAHVAAPAGGPVYRVLGAVHAFSRTLGEYQGMAQEASRLLREGGLSPNDPDAAAYLAAHSSNIYDAGLRSGAGAVFMRPNTEAQGGNFLENMFRRFNGAKEGMLASPDLKQQALGALMDFAIPFSGIPTQLLKVAANRLPVASQATGAIRAIKAGAAGDMGGMQRAIGETGLESTIQLMIAKQIADGNIAGADDPDHPDSVRVNGTWVDMKDMGGYALPMRVMASWADGYAKGGQNIPAGTPGDSPLEQTYNYYGPRFSAALTASMKPFAQAVPGENMMKLLVDMGSGGAAGGVPGVALGLGQNVANRVAIPGIARFAENLSDPVARDIDKKGVDSLWKGPMSNWPGLSGMLPAKIDPTTGQPVAKPSSGLGIFLGAKNDVASPLTIEARRLNDAGFSVTAPKTYPTEVTVAGSKVSLSPDEQRQVAQATGATMDRLATQRLQSPEYQNATDARKALMLKAMITAADNTRVAAVQKVLGPAEWRSRIAAGRNVAGQLVNQAQMPTADDFAGFNPLSGETIGAQRALAGVR